MDKASGAFLVVVALFGLWLLNTGRLQAVGAIITQGPGAAVSPSSPAAGGAKVAGAAPCHNFLSSTCGSAIASAASQGGLNLGADLNVLKGLFG